MPRKIYRTDQIKGLTAAKHLLQSACRSYPPGTYESPEVQAYADALDRALVEAMEAPPTTGTGEPMTVGAIARRAKLLVDYWRQLGKGGTNSDLTSRMWALSDAIDGDRDVARTIDLSTGVIRGLRGDAADEIDSHESFGVIQFARSSGSRALFGASARNQGSYISVRIKRAVRIHSDLDGDFRYSGSYSEYGDGTMFDSNIVELALSATQFAEAITCMGVGDGVPCTLESVRGVRMDGVPDMEDAHMKVYRKAMASIAAVTTDDAAANAAAAHAILEKKSIGKGDRAALRALFAKAQEGGATTAAWASEQLQVANDDALRTLKADAAASLTHLVTSLGLRALAAKEGLFSSPEEKHAVSLLLPAREES